MEQTVRKLVVLSSVAKGASFLLTETQVGIGREDDSPVCLEDDLISRHHAVLIRVNGEFLLRDLNSANGTFLNGQPVKESHLKVGDRIRLGDVELGYEDATVASPTEIAEPASEPAAKPKSARRATRKSKKSVSKPKVTEDPSPAPSPATVSVAAKLDRPSAESESAEIKRLEAELAEARATVQRAALLSGEARQTGEAELREKNTVVLARLEAVERALEKVRILVTGDRLTELEPAIGELAQVRAALKTITEVQTPMAHLARENEELRQALAKSQEETAMAHRCLSDKTTKEFSLIRQSMIEKNAAAESRGVLRRLSAARRALHLW